MAKVKIYSTATCAFCKAEKAWLQSKNIEFEDIRVDQDAAAAREMVEMSGQMAVPFTVIETDDGKTESVLGFDKPRLGELLGIS